VTRLELLTAIGYELGKNTSSWDTLTKARIHAGMNRRHRQLASLPGLQHLRETTLSFASTASQAFFGLPNIAKVNRCWDVTNDREIFPMTLAEYRRRDPDASNNEGTPTHLVWSGYGPIARRPANASELFWKSTSASDTQSGYLEGLLTGNYPRLKTTSLTGVTAVTADATITTWVDLTKVYLSAAAAGVVTLHEDSGVGTELARIGIGQTQQRYWQGYLWQTPSAAVDYVADVTREVTDLAQDTDEPILPADFHDLLFLGGAMDEYRHTDDTRYTVAAQEYRKRENDLKYWLAETAAGSEEAMADPPSSLGAWFPAGS
jgi:hypothetical protein